MRIGWIGTGVMGASMAGHLLDAGHQLWVSNRTRVKAENLLAAGATWCDSPAAVAAAVEVVFTIVGFPQDGFEKKVRMLCLLTQVPHYFGIFRI